jgi:hypothetical protein
MRNIDTTSRIAWLPAFKFLGFALAGAVAAAIFAERGRWVGAVLFTLMAVLIAIVSCFWRKGGCPGCGTTVTLLKGSLCPCPNCGEYAEINGGRLVPVDPDQVTSEAMFDLEILPLLRAGQTPATWRWPREGCCCVCGAPATHSENLDVHFGSEHGLTPTELYASFRIPVPHCHNHHRGVSYKMSVAILQFRSHAYWREFRQLNSLAEQTSRCASLASSGVYATR